MQAHTASDSPRRGRRGRGAYLPDRLGSSLPASAQIGLRRRTQLTPRIRLYPNCISELIPAAALLSPPARQQRSSSHTRDSLASETVGRTKDRYMAKGRYKRRVPGVGTLRLLVGFAFPIATSRLSVIDEFVHPPGGGADRWAGSDARRSSRSEPSPVRQQPAGDEEESVGQHQAAQARHDIAL